ncbi:MAG: glycerophosphoryl diester phosphodiesterase membrane domain-containing protein, partial [Actinomycetota bacterium]
VVPLSFISALFSGVIFEGSKHTVLVLDRPVEVIDRSFAFFVAGALITAIISVIITAMLQAAILRAAAQATIGDPVDPEESYRFGFKRLGSVILVSLLVGLAVLGGLILLIIPGLIFGVLLCVSVPVLIVENRRGREALSRSWNLVKGHFWHALGVIFVAGIIVGIVSGIIGAIGGSEWVIRWIFSAIAQILTAPFTALVSVLLYLDLRARSEALSASTLRAELAAAGSAG